MTTSRKLLTTAIVCATALLVGCNEAANTPPPAAAAPAPTPAAAPAPAPMAAPAMPVGNVITGEGMPNPNPTVTQNWGELPEGRTWGSSAGIDIDPNDGHIWAYERCGAGNFGAGGLNRVGAVADLRHQRAQVLLHGHHGLQQAAYLVVPLHGNHGAQVPCGDALGHLDGLIDGLLDAARDAGGQRRPHQQRGRH